MSVKDAINEALGRGCHCRNCEFKENRQNGGFGGFKCKLGILNQNRINHNSFCSEGIPKTSKNSPLEQSDTN